VLSCCALWFFTVGAHSRPTGAIPPRSATPRQDQKKEPVPEARFSLYPDGIFPSEVTVTKETINLKYEDWSDESDGLFIVPDDGTEPSLAKAAAKLQRKRFLWRGNGLVKLQKGRYWVIAGSRPQNRAALIVQ